MTKQEAVERYQRAEREHTLLLQASQDLATDQVLWVGVAGHKLGRNGHYKFGVSRLAGALGGLFHSVFTVAGQTPSYSVQPLDDVLAYTRNNPGAEYTQLTMKALGRAQQMRTEAITAHRGVTA